MIALLTACLCFEILVHMLNCISKSARAKNVFGHLEKKCFGTNFSPIARRTSDVMTQTRQTNKLEWWMLLKISLTAKAGIPKTLVKRKLRIHSLYFPQNTLMFIESRGESSDLHSIVRLRRLRYFHPHVHFSQSLSLLPG